MAVVLYKCDTCKREVEKIQNPRGLEVVNRCVITLGCRGSLYQTSMLNDFSRSRLPSKVEGLDDYQQRRVLANHQQERGEKVWTVVHKLGSAPIVSVFTHQQHGTQTSLVETQPQDIEIVDADTIKITFATQQTGIAQVVARASDPQLFQPLVPAAQPTALVQITNNRFITLATKIEINSDDSTTMVVELTVTTPTGLIIPFRYTIGDEVSSPSAWFGDRHVLIRGAIYQTRALDVITDIIRSGSVPDGSVVAFSGITYHNQTTTLDAVQPRMVYVLLSKEPHTTVDRRYDVVVDAGEIDGTVAAKQMVLQGTEFVVTGDLVQTIHPQIKIL